MSTRCECCDLPVASCGKAAQRRQDKALARWREGLVARGWFPANYPGTCKCGEPFTVGALIVMDRGFGHWITECCAPDDPWGAG